VRVLKLLWYLAALIGIVALVALAALVARGVSARNTPTTVETTVARMARHALIPSAARSRQNPEPGTKEIIQEGLEHWADHCASCHANNGSGDTDIGRNLYPRVPDMRLPATQSLTDGELFYIIEHGVMLTGMPAWGTGTAEGETASWHLVHFIRALPSLTEDQLAEMVELNPRSPAEWQAHEEERRFLAGESATPPPSKPQPHKH
jgi:mono/diheme cytochrome c family protein